MQRWPRYDAEQIDAAIAVLRSGKVNYWTGDVGRRFESEFAKKFECCHALSMANGTLALDAALRACGIRAGDEVIVTPRSFMASTSSVILLGARPVFVDVDPDSQNITVAGIEAAITPRTRALLPVHLAGWPCEMREISEIARAHKLSVVEDCAQANGAKIHGQHVGSFGQVGAFSFCQDKIITTGGEGGMACTGDDELMEHMWSFRDHGKTLQSVGQPSARRTFRYVHESIGSNYRMCEFQAAIGCAQLNMVDAWVAHRRANAAIWIERLRETGGIRVPLPPQYVHHAYYRFYAFVTPEVLRADWSRDRIIAEMNDVGVPCFSGSCPEIYLERAVDRFPEFVPQQRLPVARTLGETSLALLVDPTVTVDQIHRQADALQLIMARAIR